MTPRSQDVPPNAHVVAGEWPDAELDGSAAAGYAQAIARRLKDAIGDRSVRSVARDADLSHATLNGLLAGNAYPDLRTIAALESTLDLPLLPDWSDRRAF